MNRSIDIKLNDFPTTPPLLVASGAQVVSSLTIDVKEVLHHYFLAKYGDSPVDPGGYEYEQFLTDGIDWRFRGGGIGVDKEAKRNVSNELGKGFARWFLYKHLDFTYFCPFEDLVGRTNEDGSKWERKSDGDLPDYVCGKSHSDVNLLEAKGRYHSVTFKTKEFQGFRDQIQRARLVDAQGNALQVKGLISVGRWATEETPRVRSTLLVEDPVTEGEPPGPDGFPIAIGRTMAFGHYAPVLGLLRLPVLADSLRLHRPVPQPTGARRGLWRCIAGPLNGRRFVGGLLSDRLTWGWAPHWPFYDELPFRHSPFVLARPPRFFGLDERVMQGVLSAVRSGVAEAAQLERVRVPEEMGSLSLLRDGTVLGPADYFEPVDVLDM